MDIPAGENLGGNDVGYPLRERSGARAQLQRRRGAARHVLPHKPIPIVVERSQKRLGENDLTPQFGCARIVQVKAARERMGEQVAKSGG